MKELGKYMYTKEIWSNAKSRKYQVMFEVHSLENRDNLGERIGLNK